MYGNNLYAGLIFHFIDEPMTNNIVANNLIYHNPQPLREGQYPPAYKNFELSMQLIGANTQQNWSPCDPNSPLFGGNKFYNNLIRDEDVPAGNNGMSGDYKSVYLFCQNSEPLWTLDQLQSDPVFSAAWKNNIGADPMLALEKDDPNKTPDAFGLTSNWWFLRQGSPAINAGVAINDRNGQVAENEAIDRGEGPGYGWGNLTYVGAAPDIGANETEYDISVPVD